MARWAAPLAMLTCGCAGFWDEITSRDARERRSAFKNLFVNPDPLVVLRESNDGGKQGQALAALRNPGKDPQKQELYFQLLTAAATGDPGAQEFIRQLGYPPDLYKEPMCCLGAIRALATYQDPRAVEVLKDAFQGIQRYRLKAAFTPEINSYIRKEALASLGQIGDLQAQQFLILVAKSPPGATTSDMADRQQTLDERLAAIRSLGRFKKNADSAEVLIHVLETERDVALRNSANQSLQQVTGKNFPADARVWRAYQENPNSNTLPREPSLIQRASGWLPPMGSITLTSRP